MISIIIPIYNHPKELAECLASIEAQTYQNFEVILVNDRSTTRLSSVISPFRERLGLKLSIFNNQANHGAPYSRNKGFKHAKGEYILFCDADIVLRPEALEKMHDRLQREPEAGFVYCNHVFGWKKFRFWPFDLERLKQTPYVHSTSLLRQSVFPPAGWDESLQRLQDWDFFLRIALAGWPGIWLDEYLFTIQSGGTMSVWRPKLIYKLLPFLPSVVKYKQAARVVKEKHGI